MRYIITLFLLLTSIFSEAQIQPIIDNGYYSVQDWGGAIHPSGKYYVKADRSNVCARDVATDALLQTYHSPCIAQSMYFTPNGKYLVIQTIGEIDNWCNRTTIFDFYTGKQLYDNKGQAIMNYSDGNFIFVYEKMEEKENSSSYYKYNKITFSDSLIVESKAPNTKFDTITILTGKDKVAYEINKWVDKTYFKEQRFVGDTLREIYFSIDPEDIFKNLDEFDFNYEIRAEVTKTEYNSWSIAINDTIFIKDDNDVIVFSFAENKEIGRLDSVKIFNANYLKTLNSLYLKHSYENKLCRIILKDLKKHTNRYLPYAHHYKIINDSILIQTRLDENKISFGEYNFKKGEGFWKYNQISHKIPYNYFFDEEKYTSSIALRKNIILHNYDYVIDTDRKLIKEAKYFVDTTLLHPGVIGFSPDSSGLFMINELFWDINSINQITPCNELKPVYFNSIDSTEFKPIKSIHEKYHYLQHLSMFGFNRISYPISTSNMFRAESEILPYNYNYSQIVDAIETNEDFLLKDNKVYIVNYDSLLKVASVQSKSVLLNNEKKYDAYLKKQLNSKNILRLNTLPDYTLYSVLFDYESNNKYYYVPPIALTKSKKTVWYFGSYNTNRLFSERVSTKDKHVAIETFTRNLFTSKITYANPYAIPFFQVSILNTEELPDLGYAGIIPKNDIYFNTLNIPMPDGRIAGINYAHGTVQLKNAKNELISESSFYKGGDYIHVLPNGYYYASKGKFNKLSIRVDSIVYPVEQFDIKYNRPDIVLEAMGCKNTTLLKLYHSAYIKRLKKLGFTEEMLRSDYHLPEIEIKNINELPLTIDSTTLQLNLDINDNKYKLDRINIFINDVPVYGSAGIDLRKENTQSLHKKFSLQLSEGQNKIQVSVLNQAGAESYKETAYVTYKPKQSKKPDLYLVTIGDSKYADARFNLTYAAKDAEDIKKTFEGNSSYTNVFTYSYTNEKVTRENILKLKNELKKAKRDDVVIITVAGHGVLDKNLDYYLATYDMDFNNPSGKGIPYEELESLVDGIAPLKKVIFLDACHSGEVDKEEVEQLAVNTSSSGNVKFRAAGAGIQKKNLGLKTTSELMTELFTDLRKGTGATVISSAGGAEYAMESDQWKNGLFTYCLLHGLKDKAADANGDGQIMLSELQNYLRKEVTTLSNGAQQPTSRIENLSMDFRIW